MKKRLLTLVLLIIIFSLKVNLAMATDSWETVTPPGASSISTIASFGNYVFVGTASGIYRSTDGGNNWSSVNTGLTNQNITSIAIGWIYDGDLSTYTADASSEIFVSTPGGIFKNTLEGSTWSAINTGLTDTDVNDIEIDQYQATQGSYTNIYAATASGVFLSTDNGSTWSIIDSGLAKEVLKITSDFGNGVIYASTASSVFSSSLSSFSGSPESWLEIFNEVGVAINDIGILNPLGQTDWVSTDGGIYKSDVDGVTFTQRNGGLPSNNVLTVASDYADANISYAVVSGNGVYRTVNETILTPQWISLASSTLPSFNITKVVTNPSNSNLLYAITSSDVYKIELSTLYVDLTEPSTISDLAVSDSSGYIRLTWTAPGDDYVYGTTTSYIFKYASSTLDASSWDAATVISGGPTPDVYGQAESFDSPVLSSGGPFYFAIKSVDNNGNTSAISNITIYTPPADTTEPTAPSSLSQDSLTTSSIELSWSASIDDESVAGYVIYRNNTAIATTSSTSYTDTGLNSSTAYTYKIKAYDPSFNYSSASDEITITTSTESSSSGGGGGGGGGGSSSSSSSRSNQSTPSLSPSPKNSPTTIPISLITTVVTESQTFPEFIKNLSRGSSDPDVRILQSALYTEKFLSVQETSGVYDLNTIEAVKKFQKVYGIADEGIQGYGVFGPRTRAKLNEILKFRSGGGVRQITNLVTSTSTISQIQNVKFFRVMRIGTRGSDVKNLQIFFNSIGIPVAQSGAGSPGNETEYYGLATTKAVVIFQEKYRDEILTPIGLQYGTGIVGPATLKKLNDFIESQTYIPNTAIQ